MKKAFLLLLLIIPALASTAAAQSRKVSAVLNGVRAATFSDREAASLAAQAVAKMDAEASVAPASSAYAQRLTRIFSRHRAEGGLALNYKVYQSKEVNAFAAADGSVRVFSGLLDLMTDDEIRSVVGHEIGHVANKDTRDAIKQAYKRAAIADAMASTGSSAARLTDSQLGVIADAIAGARYSRKQETAADDYAYNFMKKHRYNVMAQISSFRKLEALSGGNGAPAFLSSHPDNGDRAARIEAKAKADGLYRTAPAKVTAKKR